MCTVRLIWLRGMIFVAGILLAIFLPRAMRPAAMPTPARAAVVVELFTSEGCSSCPPADDLLGRLRQEKFAEGLEVIPLGLHVDYWNFQGWTDRFSSAGYSERQADYARKLHLEGPYTPQMVVDGAAQFVGSDASRARKAIAEAALRPQGATIEISSTAENKLLIRVKATPPASGEVMLALTEDGLSSNVRAGENSGRELRHSAVVRELRSLGRLRNGGFETRVPLTMKKDWKRENIRVVVFVQEESGKIDGAAEVAAASLPAAG